MSTVPAVPLRQLRTLVIAPNWIGDAIMAQPLLALLKQQHPDRPIDVVASAWVALVLAAMPEVDSILTTGFKHGSLQLRERWHFARQLRARGYAAAYVLPNTLKFALLPWLAGIRLRVGYKGESRYGLINRMHYDQIPPRPMVQFYAALAYPSSVQAPPLTIPKPRLVVAPEKSTAVLKRLGLPAEHEVIAFAPGAEVGNAKRWPARHFAELAGMILQRAPATLILLLGSGKDHAVCQEIAELLPVPLSQGASVHPQIHNLAGKTSLDEAVALIAHASAVVSNDSGLLHIASALNRPVVALYGPTDPDHAPPFSDIASALSLRLPCAPCRQRECPLGHGDCMGKLESTVVWHSLQAALGAG